MKLSKDFTKTYTVITQGIINIIVLGAFGFAIGYFINKESVLCGILAFVGVLVGVVLFITYALKLGGEEKDG